MRFLVIEGINNKLIRVRENWGLREEEKVETPEELMLRPWTLPIVIWLGHSKGVTCCLFCDILVMWWEPPESGYQVWVWVGADAMSDC